MVIGLRDSKLTDFDETAAETAVVKSQFSSWKERLLQFQRNTATLRIAKFTELLSLQVDIDERIVRPYLWRRLRSFSPEDGRSRTGE